jgi:hypothetical protein
MGSFTRGAGEVFNAPDQNWGVVLFADNPPYINDPENVMSSITYNVISHLGGLP